MARHVIATGAPRTGTAHLAYMFRTLFEANNIDGQSFHQKGPSPINTRPYFSAFWELSTRMVNISQKFPWTRWIILLREPERVIQSLKWFYTKRGHKDKDADIKELTNRYWIHPYRHILDQIPSIYPRPAIMWSEDYFNGKYNKLLLSMYDIPETQENLNLMNTALKQKLNNYENAPEVEFPDKLRNDCMNILARIESMCAESWIDKEVNGNEDYTGINLNYPPMWDMKRQKCFGAVMGQTFTSLFVFEWILNFYPIDWIIELGTGCGGLSMFFAKQAEIRGLNYRTYDAQMRQGDKANFETFNPPLNVQQQLAPYYRKMNVFDDTTVKEITDILHANKCFIYCDNGAKPREVKTYAPHITQGSVIGTHDWHGQFGVEQLEKDLNLQVIFEDFCREHKTKQRFWYKP